MSEEKFDYDYIIIGSGFGGSVSAHRLTQKGYKVLVLEKGKRLGAKDFPKTNWNLKRWMWMPFFKFYGLFKMTFFRHVTILSGVGSGGGSLVYANTLPVPKSRFFNAPSWSHLANWEAELMPFYKTALEMLGANKNPRLQRSDTTLKELAKKIGKEEHFEPTTVAVFFGESNKTVPDPYFKGEGPERTGCNFCGGCMLGCRFNAKNTLDKNYLYLAEKNGATIQPESEVYDVTPLDGKDGSTGYLVKWKTSTSFFKKKGSFKTKGVIFAGGVLGTVDLLLKLKEISLPNLSDMVGSNIRTNSESIIPVTNLDKEAVFSKGVAIGSILHTDENSHLEPVRYSEGAGFWRLLLLPMVDGKNMVIRFFQLITDLFMNPVKNMKVIFTDDWSKRTSIMLFMQTLESTLKFKKGLLGMRSTMDKGEKPSAFIPEAIRLVKEYAKIINGKPFALVNEAILGIPSTAHILGGAVMGKDKKEGVIDKDNKVFGYKNMLVCDGSMISANIGVNPSLTIATITERAMSKIQSKKERYGMLKVINPATNEVVQELEEDTSDSIVKKFDQAVVSQKRWMSENIQTREKCLQKFSDFLLQEKERLANLLSSETGKPITQAGNEIKATTSRIEYFLKNTSKVIQNETVLSESSLREVISYEPLGIIANISAWNYPYFVGSNVFVPALLTGNAVLYKPSEYASLTGLAIAELLHKSGVPKDVFVPIIGDGRIGGELLKQKLNGIFFTGSYATGMKIAQATEGKIKLQLELGGKDPVYVCEDADISVAAVSLADGAFYNTGQSCCSVERIYVHKSIYDEFVEKFVKEVKSFKIGLPSEPDTYIAPLTRAPQVQFLEKQVENAVSKGAKVLIGGNRLKIGNSKNYFEPTVLVNVDHTMDVMKEESFGPIIGIQKVGNNKEAIELMNDTEYGLTAGVYSKDMDQAKEILTQVNSGSVYWNCCDRVSPRLPWTGRKHSGIGSTLSHLGILAFVQPKAWHLKGNF